MAAFSSLKILAHEQRLRDGLRNYRTPPITLDIDLTNYCNNRCPKCTYAGLRKQAQAKMPTDLALNILEQAAQFGIKGITFTGGGEPTLHPDFALIVEHCRRLGLQCGLITNGLIFTEKMSRAVLAHLQWIRFSVDAGSADVYKATHGLNGTTFANVVNNLQEAVKAKNELDLSTRVGMSYLIFHSDRADFQAAIDLAEKIGLDYIQFKPMHQSDPAAPGGRRFDELALASANEILEGIREASAIKDKVYLSRFRTLASRTYQKCHGQQWTTAVGADGKLYVCCEYKYDPRFLLGDLRVQTLREIWESENRKAVLARLNVDAACFTGCKLHDLNNTLEPLAGLPDKLDELISYVRSQTVTDVNFI